jgi:hypothetical protein
MNLLALRLAAKSVPVASFKAPSQTMPDPAPNVLPIHSLRIKEMIPVTTITVKIVFPALPEHTALLVPCSVTVALLAHECLRIKR